MSTEPTRDIPAAPAPSATATGPADRVQEDAAKARTLLSGVLLDELARRVLDYENAITWNTSCLSCPRVLDSAYEETMRREAAEAKLAALAAAIPPERFRSLADWFDTDDEFKVTMFPETWPHREREVQDDLRRFADLLGTGQEPLSAACTGPGCGEQFADSETGEYLFATRGRMELLLRADGWQAGPVLCPACQQEPAPAGLEAAGQMRPIP